MFNLLDVVETEIQPLQNWQQFLKQQNSNYKLIRKYFQNSLHIHNYKLIRKYFQNSLHIHNYKLVRKYFQNSLHMHNQEDDSIEMLVQYI